jgi:hypothetical protein
MNANANGAPSRQRRTGLRRAGMPAAALAATALLAAACGSGSPAAATSKTYQKALAFTQCMRSHGDPAFPSPTSQGTYDITPAEANSPLITSGLYACRALIPPNAVQPSAAQRRDLVSQALKESACMRSHGYPNFPDPTVGQNGDSVSWQVGPPMGINTKSPQFQSAQQLCNKLYPLPGGGGA